MDAHVDREVPSSEATSSWWGRLAWPLGTLGILLSLTNVLLVFLNRSAIHSLDQADPIEVVLPLGYSIIGALLVSRRPRNPIGWIFLGIGIFTGLPGISTQYVFRSAHFHRLPLVAWVAWTNDWMVWLVFPAGLAAFFFLLFPDGRFQSHRWRRLGWASGVILVAGVVLNMLEKTIELTGSPAIRNPLAAIVDLNGLLGLLTWLPGLAIVVASMVGVVMRMRRATGESRQQLRWLAYAAAATAIGVVANVVGFIIDPKLSNAWFDLVIVLGFGVAVPVSCGLAILRHGLYELDVVVSKTVVYGVLAAFFTAVYVAVVVGVGTAIGSTHNPFLTVLAAVVIALAFNPVRDRAKRFANRIVYGKRASPYEVLSEFTERMAGTYSLEDVLPRMAAILGEGTGASWARVWLRIGDELRPEASWGDQASAGEPMPMSDGELPAIAGVSKVVAVRHQGDLLGALTVTKPQNDPLTPAESKLVEDLATQAGLVVRNVRLTEELRANLEELRASRQRIVVAQDQERRRLERNIHDGAQQDQVALTVKLRLAGLIAEKDPAKTKAMLDEVQSEATGALENLRDLARGIYPPLLADQGLVTALSGQGRKAPFPVTVDGDGVGRYSEDTEAAVYFCCLEALQNVAKYAGATHVAVRLSEYDGDLRFEVTDDGVGFDPKARGYGTGLQGMADRLAALAGALVVTSSPGAGTTVTGRIPVRAPAADRATAQR